MAAVRLLLDTHALLWWPFEDFKLSSAARLAIANPQNQIPVSAASAWEITTKHRSGGCLKLVTYRSTYLVTCFVHASPCSTYRLSMP